MALMTQEEVTLMLITKSIAGRLYISIAESRLISVCSYFTPKYHLYIKITPNHPWHHLRTQPTLPSLHTLPQNL